MHNLTRTAIVAGLIASCFPAPLASAQEPRAQRGRVFAQTNCAMCHAIGRTGDSPLAIAPPFRTLHKRYPVDDLEESLAEGIVTGHPTMPQFQLDIAQIGVSSRISKRLNRRPPRISAHSARPDDRRRSRELLSTFEGFGWTPTGRGVR